MSTQTSTPSFALSRKKIKELGSPYSNVITESESQEFALGTIYAPDDGSGREYRYCKNGAVALAAGALVQAPAPIANHQEHVGGAGTVGAAGSKEITVGLTMTTALTDKQYDDGFVHVNKVTGLGYAYRIKEHTDSVTPVLTLHDEIVVALDTTSEITLTHNPFNGVIVAPTTLTAQLVGVPGLAVTAAYYFWLQTKGPAAVLVDTGETLVIGETAGYPATISVAGACGVPAVTDQFIGKVLSVNAAAEYALIDLNL